MNRNTSVLMFVFFLVLSVTGGAFAQARPPVDYSDKDCDGKDLCKNEKKAFLDAALLPSGFLAKYRYSKAKSIESKIQETNYLASKVMFSKEPKLYTDKIAQTLAALSAETSMGLKAIKDERVAREKFPASKCVYDSPEYNSDLIYYLCAERALLDKLRAIQDRPIDWDKILRAKHMMADVEAGGKRFAAILSGVKSKVASGNIVTNSRTSIPHISVIGVPSLWLGRIQKEFAQFASKAHKYAAEVASLAQFDKDVKNEESRAKAIATEKERLKLNKFEIDDDISDLDSKISKAEEGRKLLESDLSGAKGRIREYIGRLPSDKGVRHVTEMSGVAEYESSFIIATAGTSQADFPFGLGDAYKDVTHISVAPKSSIYVQFEEDHYQFLNGMYIKGGGQLNVPSSCGERCLMPEEPRGVLLVRFLCNEDTDKPFVVNHAMGFAAMVRNPTAAGVHCKRFGFALNEDQHYLRGLSTFGYSKRILPIQYNVYVSKHLEFNKATKHLFDQSRAILDSAPFSATPLVSGRAALKKSLLGQGVSEETIRLLEPYITELVNVRLLQRKIEGIDHKIIDLSNEVDLLKNRMLALEAVLEKLDESISGKVADKGIIAMAEAYSAHKIALFYGSMTARMIDLESKFKVYLSSVFYRYPNNDAIGQNYVNASSMIRDYLKIPGPVETRGLANSSAGLSGHCQAFESIGHGLKGLCEKYDRGQKAEEMMDVIKDFFIEADRKWRVQTQLPWGDIKHCQLDFSSPQAKRYLKSHHDGAESVRQLFHGEKWVKKYYYARTDKSRFNRLTACHLVKSNLVSRCLALDPEETPIDTLMGMEGYFEIPLTAIFNDPDSKDNMTCSDDYSDGFLLRRLLGVGMESESSQADMPNNVPVFFEKAHQTWAYKYEDDQIFRWQANVYNEGSATKWAKGKLDIRHAGVYSKKFLHGPRSRYACAGDYAKEECIKTMLGEIWNEEDSVYRFRTTFLNSRLGNEWVLRIPLYKENGDPSVEKEMIERLENLSIHFFYTH